MKRTLLCVPNVSEGRDEVVVEGLAAAVRGLEGVRLLDHSADPDHNRSVFAYLGEPQAVLAATRALAEMAWELIDMRGHRGRHPRLGAVDVVPFVPVRGVSMEEGVDVCRRFGRWAGERGVPVYYYEEAATRPERRDLPALRRGEYEGLAERLATPEGEPDEGPARFHPRAGALVTGVRGPLVAFNVNLRSEDLGVARELARTIRESDGGYRYVRAIGVPLRDRGMVQVSMNLIRPAETPLASILETVRSEAARHGVEVAGTELVGPVPLGVVVEAFRDHLQAQRFAETQIVETGLME